MNDNVRNFPQKRRPEPFEVFYPINWQGRDPAPIRWLVRDCVPRGTVCLFSGDSGLGKSLLMQQLQTCAALAKPWLGFPVEPCRSFGFYCEDPLEILHWRQKHINAHFAIDMNDVEDVSLISRVGMDNVLMDFNRKTDQGQTTYVYEQLRAHVTSFGAELVIIDTAAQVFNGMEISRVQVTTFMNALLRIAMEIDGAVVLTAHPSNDGLASGRGTSGSGAWRATSRAHMYLKRPKGYDEDDENARDERLLKTMKSNWGPGGGNIRLQWSDGVFVRMGAAAPGLGNTVDRLDLDNRLVAALAKLVENGTLVPADHRARNGFANVVRTLPEFRAFSQSAILNAQERLLAAGRITRVELGPQSKRRVVLRPPELRYPGEESGDAPP